MKTLIVGGNASGVEVAKQFDGTVDLLGFENYQHKESYMNKINLNEVNIGSYHMILFPLNGIKNNQADCKYQDKPVKLPVDFLKEAKKDCSIFTGVMTPDLIEMAKHSPTEIIPLINQLSKDQQFSDQMIMDIVEDLIVHTKGNVKENCVIILGLNQLSTSLAGILKLLEIKTKVGTTNKEQEIIAEAKGITQFDLTDVDGIQQTIKPEDFIVDVCSAYDTIVKPCVGSVSYVVSVSELVKQTTAPKQAASILTKKIRRTGEVRMRRSER